MNNRQKSQIICRLNDRLRQTGQGGRVMTTCGIAELEEVVRQEIINAVAAFGAFDANNDPYGEHDCALLQVAGHKVMFKIDYYDLDTAHGSEDPADEHKTRRVLTIMLAAEY